MFWSAALGVVLGSQGKEWGPLLGEHLPPCGVGPLCTSGQRRCSSYKDGWATSASSGVREAAAPRPQGHPPSCLCLTCQGSRFSPPGADLRPSHCLLSIQAYQEPCSPINPSPACHSALYAPTARDKGPLVNYHSAGCLSHSPTGCLLVGGRSPGHPSAGHRYERAVTSRFIEDMVPLLHQTPE